jgi:hypothetical protein
MAVKTYIRHFKLQESLAIGLVGTVAPGAHPSGYWWMHALLALERGAVMAIKTYLVRDKKF